jgi:CBS domain-containing protein
MQAPYPSRHMCPFGRLREGKHSVTHSKEAFMSTKVKDVMTERPRSVTADTTVDQVAELMEAEDVGVIPIVDGDRLLGVVTDRDIVLRAVARRKDPRGMPAREVASQDLVTVEPETKLDEALKLMARYQVRRLPVVEDGDRLVGVVSQADVALEAKEKTTGELVEEISRPPEGPRL